MVVLLLNVRVIGDIKATDGHILKHTIIHLDSTILLGNEFITIVCVAVITIPHQLKPMNVFLHHFEVWDWAVTYISFVNFSEATFAKE